MLPEQYNLGNVDYGKYSKRCAMLTYRTKYSYTNPSLPLFSIGMSNGGAFSNSLSYLYKFKTAVAYCAQGYQVIFNTSTIPASLVVYMAKYDDNSEVGAAGDATALTYSQQLTGRGVCSNYFAQR